MCSCSHCAANGGVKTCLLCRPRESFFPVSAKFFLLTKLTELVFSSNLKKTKLVSEQRKLFFFFSKPKTRQVHSSEQSPHDR